MTDRELMQQALDALEKTKPKISEGSLDVLTHDAAITALRDRLAQSEQKPVGKFAQFTDGIWREVTVGSPGVPLYTTPPQRPWVGLTDEEIETFVAHLYPLPEKPVRERLQVLLTKLRERNT